MRQHGVKGVYLGGEWVDIEDCASQHHIKDGSCKPSACSTCPRSRTAKSAAKADGSYDVIVIGAGCIGAAITRELSRYAVSVLWLESADDVTQGATKGNSGIVHAGFDDTPGSNRAKYCWPGNQMFESLDRELHFGYQKNGSLVLATNEEERKHLSELKIRGEKNGVQRLRIVDKDELFKIEPHVNPNCVAALLAPDAGNLIPYEYTVALAENAVDNGVELRIRREVVSIAVLNGGGEASDFEVTCKYWEPAVYANAMGLPVVNLDGSGNPFVVSGVGKHQGLTTSQQLGIIVTLVSSLVRSGVLALSMDQLDKLVVATSLSREVIMAAGCVVCLALLMVLKLLLDRVLGGSSSSTELSNVPLPTVGKGGKRVTVEEMRTGGSGSQSQLDGVCVAVEKFRAKYIVNAAGSGSDTIAKMIGDKSFKIKPRIGDYILLNRDQGHLARHTLFPCPGPLGKGVLVQTTLWGNLILGPTARDMHLPEVAAETESDIQKFILAKCRQLVPAFDPKQVIHSFCGARAKSDRGDWIIEPSAVHPRFIHAAGIDSPGLAGSPAIALEIVRLLQVAQLVTPPNPAFNPKRAPLIIPKDGMKGLSFDGTMKPLKYSIDPTKASSDPESNVICKCEKTTEAEVVAALRRNLPIDSTQAIRKRTRAGMGHCQAEESNYNCECRVAEIIARETSTAASIVGRRPWPATSTLSERWVQEEERKKLEALFLS